MVINENKNFGSLNNSYINSNRPSTANTTNTAIIKASSYFSKRPESA